MPASFRLNTEDIRASLRDLGDMFRIASLVFLLPIPFTIYFALVKKTVGQSTDPSAVLGMLASTTVQGFIDLAGSIFFRSLSFVAPAIACFILYSVLRSLKAPESTKTRHLLMSVSLAWLLVPLIGSLPFLLTGTLSPVDSFFESMSGWTTTGFTLIKDLDSAERDILFYRSLSQWVSGVAVVFVALTVFLKKGSTAASYYFSERGDVKMKPSTRGTITETLKIYLVYTVACVILLYLAGMSFFDALNHSMSTISAGGFSTHTDSAGYFSGKPLVEAVLVLFMFIGSISFLIHSRLLEGNLRSLTRNIEFRYMTSLLFFSLVFIMLSLLIQGALTEGVVVSSSIFQSVSALSSSGLFLGDISKWPQVSQAVLCVLMYIGGFYGSAAGGIKLLRFIVIFEAVAFSMKRLMLPKTAILRLKLGETAIGEPEILSAVALSAAYLGVAVIGALLLMAFDVPAIQAGFTSLSAMGNVGLSNIPQAAWLLFSEERKIVIAFLMWAGRVEVIPALVLIASVFVKRKSVL